MELSLIESLAVPVIQDQVRLVCIQLISIEMLTEVIKIWRRTKVTEVSDVTSVKVLGVIRQNVPLF